MTEGWIKKDMLKPYYKLLMATLGISKGRIESNLKSIQGLYGILESKAALHSTDKAKKIMQDSIEKIDITILALDYAIKSMP